MKNRTAHFVVETGYRVGKSIVGAAAFGLFGAATGIVVGLSARLPAEVKLSPEAKKLFHRNRLVQKVRNAEHLRHALEMALPSLTSYEYDLRRKLEAMGYYPCERCGIPHLHPDDKPNCLPPGAYWSDDLRRYVHVGHPDWSKEDYEKATGQPWAEPNEEPLH